MRRTANADLPAFHKIDARGAGFDANIAAAAEDGFRLTLDDSDTHGTADADGLALDNADRIGRRLIGASSGGDERSAEKGQTRQGKRGAPRT